MGKCVSRENNIEDNDIKVIKKIVSRSNKKYIIFFF